MRTTRSFVSALAVISVGALFIAAQPAKAENVFRWYFHQTGSNTVVVTGTGSFDTSALGTPTAVGDIDSGTADFQPGGILAGTIVSGSYNVWTDETATNPVLVGPAVFWTTAFTSVGTTVGDWIEMLAPDFDGSVGALALNADYVSGTPYSNTTTLDNATLIDFGFSEDGTFASPFLEGTWTLQSPTTGDPAGTIEIYSIYSVPEPSQMMLLAGSALTFGAWRMRKLRRRNRGREPISHA